MSGKLPIDRVRESRDAPAVYEDHRKDFAEKRANLEQTDQPQEGERRPETGELGATAPVTAREEMDENDPSDPSPGG